MFCFLCAVFWASSALGSAVPTVSTELQAIASDMAWAPAEDARRVASEALRDLVTTDSSDVGEAVARSFAWAPHQSRTFVGDDALVASLHLRPAERVAVAAELLAWRVDMVLIGRRQVPGRLAAELWGVLQPEIEAHGQPTCTIDWLYLFGAAGGDVEPLLERLGIDKQGQWAHAAHQNQTLRSGELVDVLPLLAHTSEIVRSRAARRFEAEPAEAMSALLRAWRMGIGRAPPLRGDIEVPRLPWSDTDAGKWSRVLVHWARRTNRQRDDAGLHASVRLLARPEVTSRLPQEQRVKLGKQLSRATRAHPTSARSQELVQAMDAVLRQVSWEEAHRPAPETHDDKRPTWVRMPED